MTVTFRAAILILVGFLASCAPRPLLVPTPAPPGEIVAHADFRRAERAFEEGRLAEALDGYNAFLRDAVDDPSADDALFKIGAILSRIGRTMEAVAVFSRLKREFPESDRVPDATLEILQIQFDAGEFKALIAGGRAYLETLAPKPGQAPLWSLVGEAYGALGLDLDAARCYHQAWTLAAPADVENAWKRLEKTVSLLGADDIQTLMGEVTDHGLMALLLYRLGMAYLLEAAYEDAQNVLQAFVEGFPDHPDFQDASDILNFLLERDRYTPFTIGCVLPLSGAYATFGQRALNGIELALSHSGTASDGIPFSVIVKDSRSHPDTAVKAVGELDQLKVGAILGPMVASESAAAESQARGIPIIVFTQRDGITDIGPYVFRNFITPQMQVRALVAYAMQELGARRFAILFPDEHYGRRYMNLFWDQVIEQGGVVIGVEAYDPEGVDFGEPIKKMVGIFYRVPEDLKISGLPARRPVSAGAMAYAGRSGWPWVVDPVERISGLPLDRQSMDQLVRRPSDRGDQWHPILDFDAVFIPDAPKKAGLVIPQLAYYDIRHVHLLGTNLWNSQTLLEMSGEYMKDALIVDGFFAQSRSERVKDFVAAFQLVYGRVPGIVEAVAYDSAMMVFQAMRQVASDSRRDLRQTLLQPDAFEGLSGRTTFAPNGDAQKRLQLLRVHQGRFVEVQQRSETSSVIEAQ